MLRILEYVTESYPKEERGLSSSNLLKHEKKGVSQFFAWFGNKRRRMDTGITRVKSVAFPKKEKGARTPQEKQE